MIDFRQLLSRNGACPPFPLREGHLLAHCQQTMSEKRAWDFWIWLCLLFVSLSLSISWTVYFLLYLSQPLIRKHVPVHTHVCAHTHMQACTHTCMHIHLWLAYNLFLSTVICRALCRRQAFLIPPEISKCLYFRRVDHTSMHQSHVSFPLLLV